MQTPKPKTSVSRRTVTSRVSSSEVSIDLALQGGGSHGAFTWGVLDRLLEEPDILITGVSGTSAGAMNAIALAAGLTTGGREGAIATLRALWEGVSRMGLPKVPGTEINPWLRDVQAWWGHALGQSLSPYQFNPLNLNPLRELLLEIIDFDSVRRCKKTQLFIAATHVKTGNLRIFRQSEITVDVVLASACLPLLFQAVNIDGEAYWDGGYAGNPSLLPLITETPADDMVVVQINPRVREPVPTRAQDIMDRVNEIAFNSSLIKELRSIALIQQLLQQQTSASGKQPLLLPTGQASPFKRIQSLRVHRIDGGDRLAAWGAASKLDTGWGLLSSLFELGRETTEQWLKAYRKDLGKRGSVNLAKELLP